MTALALAGVSAFVPSTPALARSTSTWLAAEKVGRPFIYPVTPSTDRTVTGYLLPCNVERRRDDCVLDTGDLSPARQASPGVYSWPYDQAATDLFVGGNPHLRVQFVLASIEREELEWANHPASVSNVHFRIASPLETSGGHGTGSFAVGLPAEGESMSNATVIYDAVAVSGCGITPYYPIDFWAGPASTPEAVDEHFWSGTFAAYDPDTIQPESVWNFAFTLFMAPNATGATNFVFSGTVVATCTAIAELGVKQ